MSRALGKMRSKLYAGHSGHFDVRQDKIGLAFRYDLERFQPIFADREYFNIQRAPVDQMTDALADQLLIVCDHKLQHLSPPPSFTGS